MIEALAILSFIVIGGVLILSALLKVEKPDWDHTEDWDTFQDAFRR